MNNKALIVFFQDSTSTVLFNGKKEEEGKKEEGEKEDVHKYDIPAKCVHSPLFGYYIEGWGVVETSSSKVVMTVDKTGWEATANNATFVDESTIVVSHEAEDCFLIYELQNEKEDAKKEKRERRRIAARNKSLKENRWHSICANKKYLVHTWETWTWLVMHVYDFTLGKHMYTWIVSQVFGGQIALDESAPYLIRWLDEQDVLVIDITNGQHVFCLHHPEHSFNTHGVVSRNLERLAVWDNVSAQVTVLFIMHSTYELLFGLCVALGRSALRDPYVLLHVYDAYHAKEHGCDLETAARWKHYQKISFVQKVFNSLRRCSNRKRFYRQLRSFGNVVQPKS